MKKIALVLMLAVLSVMQSYAQKDSTAMNYRVHYIVF